ncbi:hypothetical protein DV738_g654, partial [Chaetothyriales sp. CBS 135597]
MAQKRKLSDAAGPGNAADQPEKKARTSQDAPAASQAALTAGEKRQAKSERRSKKHRFIAFIGNLPFTTTTQALEKHFSSVAPFSLRHSTDKATGKSKGFAFIEFEDYDRMKTCLQLYHHSYFNPDAPNSNPAGGKFQQKKSSKKDKGRRINVELTAGGGGKSSRRQERIKLKNQRLAEQRELA